MKGQDEYYLTTNHMCEGWNVIVKLYLTKNFHIFTCGLNHNNADTIKFHAMQIFD